MDGGLLCMKRSTKATMEESELDLATKTSCPSLIWLSLRETTDRIMWEGKKEMELLRSRFYSSHLRNDSNPSVMRHAV